MAVVSLSGYEDCEALITALTIECVYRIDELETTFTSFARILEGFKPSISPRKQSNAV